jgi:hypothetical protein
LVITPYFLSAASIKNSTRYRQVSQIFAAFQVPFSILIPMISLNDDALNPDNFPVIGQVDATGDRFGQKTRNE